MDSSAAKSRPHTIQVSTAPRPSSSSPPSSSSDHDENDHHKRKSLMTLDLFPYKKHQAAQSGSSGKRVQEEGDRTIFVCGKENCNQQLAAALAEIDRLNAELQHLTQLLSHWKNMYNDLKARYVTLMQAEQQQQNNPGDKDDDRIIRAVGKEPVLSPLVGSSRKRQQQVVVDPQRAPERPDNNPRDTGRSADQEPANATMRKIRVAVRARPESAMIPDGCQWRKYGQKIAKGNPLHPRSYYRCTMAHSCPVRKQVQRCAEDESIQVTTYEGTHNHPLPPAAYAIASMTQSAMRTLLSGPMPSPDVPMNLNNDSARALFPSCNNNPWCLASISASAPFPTITLDLTQSPNPLQLPMMPSNNLQAPFGGQMNPGILGHTLYNQSNFSGHQVSGINTTNQEMGQGGASTSSNNRVQQGQMNQLSIDAVNALARDPRIVAALTAAFTNSGNENAPTPNNNSSSSGFGKEGH